MKLTEKEMAQLICGSQDRCVHRSTSGDGGQCGDCCIPAHLIWALENDAEIDPERSDGNHFAEAIMARKKAAEV